MKHPYIEFEETMVWKVVEKSILDLEANQDLKLTELKEYVVGYICKQLFDNKLVMQERDVQQK